MSDDEIITSLTNGGPGYLEMNEAFCARARGHRSGARKGADWCRHLARNKKSQIRPDSAPTVSLVAA
jgi:hypothetical protein